MKLQASVIMLAAIASAPASNAQWDQIAGWGDRLTSWNGIDLKAPGLCFFMEGGDCQWRSKNGLKTETGGMCPREFRSIIPTCRGHRDAFVVDPEPTPEPLKPTPPVAPPMPVEPEVPTPPPAPKPEEVEVDPSGKLTEIIQGGRKNETVNPNPVTPPAGGDNKEAAEGSSSGPFKGNLALMVVSVAAAVSVAIIAVVAVGFLAYRHKQKLALRAEHRAGAAHQRTQASAFHSPTLPVVLSPRSVNA